MFTTGGIGPTHDDITADAVAGPSASPIGEDPRVIAIMLERYAPGDLTPARRRMARIPDGAELDRQPDLERARVSHRQRVSCMAGVPSVMQAMLDFAVKTMKTGAVMLVETIEAGGDAGGALRRRARRDRRRACRGVDRLLSVLQGRAVQQPDRGARQGRRRAVAAAQAAVEAMLAELRGDGGRVRAAAESQSC